MNSWVDVAAVATGAVVTAAAFFIAYSMAGGSIVFGSALSREQRARKEALKEAKRLATVNSRDPGVPEDIIRLAEFILGGGNVQDFPR